ncbi:uncharacterized protein [Littorina saxatilis]|uniref:uncharacterized protein n=1 Tax=Littorina saxatilis TaxID=31220 RepID=UPI0038B64655
MRITSTSPVLVYVVIEMCGKVAGSADAVTSSDARCDVNAFFLPPVEQFFRCAADVSENSCDTVCPAFWNSGECALKRAMSGNQSSEASDSVKGVVMPSSSGSASEESRTWHVHHELNGTSFNTTDACVLANATYLPFRLDLASGSFLPAGTRLAKLYSACVPNISAQGGEGDGADNDCDGLVDEEVENMEDDDGDDRVDEDTSSDCADGASSRAARSGGLQRAVAEPGPPWFFDYEEEDSEMPLLAVIISLSVAIFAVIAVISIFLLMEVMSRRRQIRNTKIRPFVS